MHLKGGFTIRNATFSNEKTQADLEQLSLRGQGRPVDAKAASVEGLHSVASQMQGSFDLAEAKMTLSDLDYSVPGAAITLDGVYSLDGSLFDFHGKARLEAKLSQMVTGWRSLLLMPVDPSSPSTARVPRCLLLSAAPGLSRNSASISFTRTSRREAIRVRRSGSRAESLALRRLDILPECT